VIYFRQYDKFCIQVATIIEGAISRSFVLVNYVRDD